MIETVGLSKSYDHKPALQALDLRVEPGEILGFLGPNGAGKSTTVKILTGMIKPTSGRAMVAGFDVVAEPLEVKKRIGYVPETAALYDGLTANEYLELIACLHHLDPKTSASRPDASVQAVDNTVSIGPAASTSQPTASCAATGRPVSRSWSRRGR